MPTWHVSGKFCAKLHRLSEHCGFGCTLDEMLTDRLVCVINDERKDQATLTGRAQFSPEKSIRTCTRHGGGCLACFRVTWEFERLVQYPSYFAQSVQYDTKEKGFLEETETVTMLVLYSPLSIVVEACKSTVSL